MKTPEPGLWMPCPAGPVIGRAMSLGPRRSLGKPFRSRERAAASSSAPPPLPQTGRWKPSSNKARVGDGFWAGDPVILLGSS